MKYTTCIFLTLILMLPLLPCPVRAEANIIVCGPGETISVLFMLSQDGDQPDGVMGRLSYNTDIFTLLPSGNIIGMDGINILNREPVAVSFRVNLYAPAGKYTIEVKVIEAFDADGKQYTNARVSPVQVHVELPATPTPEHTPEPTPTGKPLPLPSAESTEKKQIKAGDYVKFGRYPQTAEGNDETLIEWLVLDVQGNKAFLLSRYGLDIMPYDRTITSYSTSTNITWEQCTLRWWLNGSFLKRAFTAKEQEIILTTKVDNSKSQGYSGWNTNGGKNTQDKIFLLSWAEANKYLGVTRVGVSNTKSRAAPTMYAFEKCGKVYTVPVSRTEDGDVAGEWWLRSPGESQKNAAYVSSDGSLQSYYLCYGTETVRPALWVYLDAGIF